MGIRAVSDRTRAAVEEGIVPGGRVVPLQGAAPLEKVKLPGDEKTGEEIVRRALEEPIRRVGGSCWLLKNTGRRRRAIVLGPLANPYDDRGRVLSNG